MKISEQDRTELASVADSINVPLAALLAVIEVESNGVTGANIGGREEPIIRYEGHYFDRLCRPSVRASARKAGVSSPIAGGVKNPASQAARWQLLLRAAKYDASAAYQSCSWGVGQVMGAHWERLGYASIDAFVESVRSGLKGQVDAMAKFIKVSGLDDELRALDWSAFARGYNGSGYRKNQYDTKMAAAYKRWGGVGALDGKRSGNLRLGSEGAGVRDLQAMLVLAGYNVVIDGDFGKTTRDAVRDFQRRHGLAVDGVVGPTTQAALAQVRDTAPAKAGQQKIMSIPDVQKGIGAAIAVPASITAAKGQLQSIVDQLSPYAWLSSVTDTLTTVLAVLTVAGLLAGVGYAVYGWWRSRQSFTGTKADTSPVQADDGGVVFEPITLPAANPAPETITVDVALAS